LRSLWIDPAQHAAAAARATVSVYFVCFPAYQGIARINRRRRVCAEQPIAFSDIKPDPFAIFATIDFDAFELNYFHVVFAFRTKHLLAPLLELGALQRISVRLGNRVFARIHRKLFHDCVLDVDAEPVSQSCQVDLNVGNLLGDFGQQLVL
jgi:hypothetical protein